MTVYLYGRHPVREALRAGRRVRRIYVAASAHGSGLAELLSEARTRDVAIETVDRRWLDARVGDVGHQGVLAEVAPFAYAGVDDLLARAAARGEPPLLLGLDSLQDPQNFGTLVRAALAAGVHGVLIPAHRSVGVTPAVSKASAGAVEHLAVAQVTNLVRAVLALKQAGVWVYGLAVDAERPFWEVDWRSPSALLVGAEGAGLGRLVRGACDELVSVPMAPGSVQSLNAATAGALALYEAFRQRRGAPHEPGSALKRL